VIAAPQVVAKVAGAGVEICCFGDCHCGVANGSLCMVPLIRGWQGVPAAAVHSVHAADMCLGLAALFAGKPLASNVQS
jgi:hypothetical protein